MNTPNSNDVLATAANVDDAGVAELATLRSELAAETADYETSRAAKKARLDQLEARFAQEAARREHAAAVEGAQARYSEAYSTYQAAAQHAGEQIAALQDATRKVLEAYAAAVTAERERQQAAPTLTGAARGLEQLGGEPRLPVIPDPRLHSFQQGDPVRFIAVASLENNGDLVREVNQLSGETRRADIVMHTERIVRFG